MGHAPMFTCDWPVPPPLATTQLHMPALVLLVRTFSKWCFFPFTSTYDPVNCAKFHGKRSAHFSEIRNADTDADRQTWQLYIYRLSFLVQVQCYFYTNI